MTQSSVTTGSRRNLSAPILIGLSVLLVGAALGIGLLYRSNMSSMETTFVHAQFQTISGLLQRYVKEHGSYPPDVNHFYSARRMVDLSGPQAITGPGSRTYRILLGRDQSHCAGPNPQAIPQDGFAVATNHEEDGCYVSPR